MSKKLIINAVEPREVRAAILNNQGEPQNFFIERSEKRYQKGNVYWAKVTSVEQHLQAAFVELERGQHGFLSLSDIMYPDGGGYLITDKKSQKYLDFEIEEKELAEKRVQKQKQKELEQKEKQLAQKENVKEKLKPVLPKVVLAPSAGDMLLGSLDDDGLGESEGERSLSPIIEIDPEHEAQLELDEQKDIEESQEQEIKEDDENGEVEEVVAEKSNTDIPDDETRTEIIDLDSDSYLEETEEEIQETQEAPNEENDPVVHGVQKDSKVFNEQNESVVLDEQKDTESEIEDQKGADLDSKVEQDSDNNLQVQNDEDNESEVETQIITEDDDGSIKYSNSNRRRRHNKKIEELLEVGQYLAVQIVKEGIGKKAPMVTTYLSLAGHYSVMMPGNEKGGVSKQIRNQKERVRLREFLDKAKLPEQCGLIVRTAAETITKKDLITDLKNITNTWKDIKRDVSKAKGTLVLKKEEGLLTRVIREYYNKDIDEIWIDDLNAYEELKDLFSKGMNDQLEKLHHYTENKSIFAHYKLENHLSALFKRKVIIPGGGSLVFDQCEAMLVIDINSGTFKEGTDDDDTASKLNMLACKEIAAQVQMRDVGGIVMIDFVDMKRISQRTKVERELEKCFKGDKAKLNFMHIGALGVMQMSRQRTKDSLRNSVYATCEVCEGTGLVPSRKYSVMGILRAIREVAGRYRNDTIKIEVTQEAALELLNKYKSDVSNIEESFSTIIEVQIKSDLSPGAFNLIQKNNKNQRDKNKNTGDDQNNRKKRNKNNKNFTENNKSNKNSTEKNKNFPDKNKKPESESKSKNSHLERLEKENPGGEPLGILPAGSNPVMDEEKQETTNAPSVEKVEKIESNIDKSKNKSDSDKAENKIIPKNTHKKAPPKKKIDSENKKSEKSDKSDKVDSKKTTASKKTNKETKAKIKKDPKPDDLPKVDETHNSSE